jgi:hypothetical protein
MRHCRARVGAGKSQFRTTAADPTRRTEFRFARGLSARTCSGKLPGEELASRVLPRRVTWLRLIPAADIGRRRKLARGVL